MSDLQVRLRYSKNEKDDWTKVEDKALRKKIQNRLAKRKSSALHYRPLVFRMIDHPSRNIWSEGQDKEKTRPTGRG